MNRPDSKATREGDVHTGSPQTITVGRVTWTRSATHGWWSADRCASYADFDGVLDRLAAAEQERLGALVEAVRIANDANRDVSMALVNYDEQLPVKSVAWKPIDTAPHDGTHVLACNASRRYDARWTFDQRPPTVVHYWSNPGEEGFYTSVNELAPERPFAATHWMPLPAPPEPLAFQAEGEDHV